ncbi:hypothetical protein [Campylobacter ureolyticus]|uniref:Uncharacterized protein n=1 Tax=Campylobacter ureolyticus TaxID=827 RepID=A0A9Q4KL41_9BACT|nr:hypothetical protein [Campylobacter ureolyticus]MCZ6103720.1 hypothetical protein [Campylobacter ureolyticus]MCZ6133857.1 hypothetical protein [Campylobacter ureolyticus]MCZ6161598.1 hypothetical protein [Campylobacter ureolyticus]MCZ6170813.1 hypothetical protein [Campylobacter ureolyticus]MDU4981641.1 hypothetical protein [Campylobacter ureolyticus]
MRFLLFITLIISLSFSKEIKNFDDAKEFINDGIEKGYFPKTILSLATPKGSLKDLNLLPRDEIIWDETTACNDDNLNALFIIDNDANNTLECSDYSDNIFILNSGNNTINCGGGDDIFFLSSGNDIITKQDGFNIFVFEKNWGNDELKISNRSLDFVLKMSGRENILGYDGSFPFDYSNFIIFGSGIKKEDLAWSGNTLINLKTNDTIKFTSDKGVNFLFKEEPINIVDNNFIKKLPNSYELNFSDKEINSITKDEKNYYILTDKALKKAILNDSDKFKIINELERLYVRNLTISDKFIFFSDSFQGYSNLNMVDKNLNLLYKVQLKGETLDMKLYKNYLYVLQNFENFENPSNSIYVYEVGKNSLNLINKIDTNLKEKDGNYGNKLFIIKDNLFIINILEGIRSYTLKEPANLQKVFDDEEENVEFMQEYGDFIIIVKKDGTILKTKFKNNSFEKTNTLSFDIEPYIVKSRVTILSNKLFILFKDELVIVNFDNFKVVEKIKFDKDIKTFLQIDKRLLLDGSKLIELDRYL